jgi:hypothetical protein
VLAALGVFALPAQSLAQGLPRVTVESFALSADTTQPRAGSPFHLIVTLRIKEEIAQVETLQLPDLAALEILGDERGLSAGPQGSVYREVVTVEAQGPGTITLDPASFDAVDARDGKAKQWSTNALVLHVTGAPGQAFARAAMTAARAILVAVTVLAAFGVVLLIATRRRAPAAEPPPSPAPPAPSARDRMLEVLALLRSDPTRAGAMRARAVLHRMVGGVDGETLHDVMLRAQQTHPVLLDVLPQIERAAFTYESDVADAVARAISALERNSR